MSRYRLEFDAHRIFTPEALPVMERYFNGEIRAVEASRRLGWSRQMFERHLAGIFSISLGPDNKMATIERLEEDEYAP